MASRSALPAVFVVVLAVAGALYTAISGNQPLLGLDLQGGVSVVLQPTTQGPEEASDEALEQTLEIIRSRVDSLGVAEPEISLQGGTIVVDLPGVEEQQRALDLVGRTAELRFRPVLFDLGPSLEFDPTLDPSAIDSGDGSDVGSDDADGSGTGDGAGGDGADGGGDQPTDTTDTTETSGDEEGSLGVPAGRFGPAQADATDEGDTTTTTTADATTTSEPDASDEGDSTGDADPADDVLQIPTPQGTADPAELAVIEVCSQPGTTDPEEDLADQPVVLADDDGFRICLGPTLLTGDTLEDAGVDIGPTGQWVVNPVFKPGAQGIDQFNAAASACFNGATSCPPTGLSTGNVGPGRLAIVLDGRIVSAPVIQQPVFPRDGIQISGSFEEEDARDLASVLRFGALPVELETQQTRTVSATIGDDVLRAGVVAGLVGLALVAVYLLAYYRLAGLVALGGLVLSALLLWTIIAWFGENLGLALTLAGVVGLIVSVGVSADSNIVYFENVKDSFRGGRTVPTSVERAYQSAISTIVKADFVSLIAAVLLYWLTVGAVRGFAFYLGLATLLDLFISWLFMRPALAFFARRQSVIDNPSLLGLPQGEKS